MIRVGIVGLGFMGKMHFRCYKALDGVTVAAICDIDEKNSQAAVKLPEISVAQKSLWTLQA